MDTASGFRLLKRLSSTCNQQTERALLGLGLLMTAIVILQVFSRYVLNHSLFWSEELARYILVWLTFLGSSVAYRRGIHPCIDIVYRRFSRSTKTYLQLLVHILSLLLFLVLIWYGCEFAYFVRSQTTAALSLPKWLIFSIIPLSATLLSIHASYFILRDIYSAVTGDE